jgi:hypothetical protein
MAKAKNKAITARPPAEPPAHLELTDAQKLAWKQMVADVEAQPPWPTAEEWEAFGRKIDYVIGVRDNLIEPPWVSNVLKQLEGRSEIPRVKAAPDSDTAAWVAAEIERMKAAGEIHRDMRITITELAQQLGKRMKKAEAANNSLRSVSWLHIKNYLPKWGLWPLK